jgi:hypothetical protein
MNFYSQAMVGQASGRESTSVARMRHLSLTCALQIAAGRLSNLAEHEINVRALACAGSACGRSCVWRVANGKRFFSRPEVCCWLFDSACVNPHFWPRFLSGAVAVGLLWPAITLSAFGVCAVTIQQHVCAAIAHGLLRPHTGKRPRCGTCWPLLQERICSKDPR